MEYEQLEIMKVIEFPKNKQFENKIRNEKLEVAIKMLEYFVGEDIEFNIVVDKKSALELFEEVGEQKLREYLIIGSSYENSKILKINADNSDLYILNGNEFD